MFSDGHLVLVDAFIGLADQPPVQDLLRCAECLFVVAMVALGSSRCRNRQIRRQRGSPRSQP